MVRHDAPCAQSGHAAADDALPLLMVRHDAPCAQSGHAAADDAPKEDDHPCEIVGSNHAEPSAGEEIPGLASRLAERLAVNRAIHVGVGAEEFNEALKAADEAQEGHGNDGHD